MQHLITRTIALIGCLMIGILIVLGRRDGNRTRPSVAVVEETQIKNSVTEQTQLPKGFLVTHVVDGDTIDVAMAGEIQRVRLIGVDTPETKDPRKPVQCFGKEASVFTKKSLMDQTVQLVSDASQDNQDTYGRLLRYVILPGEKNFNEQLIRAGYAHEYTYRVPYQYQAEFKAAQKDAEKNLRGLWAKDTCAGITK